MKEPLNILLIDDDEDDYVAFRDLSVDLKAWVPKIDWIKTFDHGREALLAGQHHVCFIDYRLGDRTGLELLRSLSSSPNRAPMILLTGQGDDAIDQEAMNAGAADYLLKGHFDAQALERSIRHALFRAKSQSEQQRLQGMVIQSEKMSAVGQLAAGVAHEINNPLSVILGFAQAILARSPIDSVLQNPLKSIERETLRCRNLVQALLTFSRAGQDERMMAKLNDTVRDALSLIQAEAKLMKVDVKTDLSPDVPVLFCNPNQIQQVIINLSNNAIDAMGSGGCLEVGTKLRGDYAVIQVTDTGSGIAAHVLPRIFEPFFTTKPVGKGTGLGLSLAYEIVQKHGGKIDVQSRPGETIFSVQIPLQPAQTLSKAA